MEIARKLAHFYSINPPDLSVITNINKRHFRLLLPNGRFFKLKDTIRSARDLQDWLVKLAPLDVYYSTSTYLNPTGVASRPKKSTDYWGPGNVVLGHDIAFDIDRRPLSLFNLERARKDALSLHALVTGLGCPLKYIAFSGSKGFHLVFQDPEMEIEPDYRVREKALIRRRKALVEEVERAGIAVDAAVTTDTRRIIRLPGTVNSKTGLCCQVISLEELHRPVSSWMEGIARLDGSKPIPRFKMGPLRRARPKAKRPRAEEGAEIGYTTFLSSSVLGTKGRHAVLISLPKAGQARTMSLLRMVQEEYDLTDIYLFELPGSYQAICLKTVQRNRYQKILDFIRSPSAHQLRRYDRVSLRMGPLVDSSLRMLEPPAQFITFLECPSEARGRNFVSRGHINFLRKHGMAPLDYPSVHGSEEFQLVDAEIRL
jgi:DNA primase catalytic subunit